MSIEYIDNEKFDLDDDGDMWRYLRKKSQQKRQSNKNWSLNFLESLGIKYLTLNESIGHYRIGDWDFWPSTGKFWNKKLNKKGRGIKNLIKLTCREI